MTFSLPFGRKTLCAINFQIPAPYKVGIAYDAVCVNPLEYLPWLRSKLKSSVANKQRVQKTGLLVNATSLGPRSLIGVEDTAPLLNREQCTIVEFQK